MAYPTPTARYGLQDDAANTTIVAAVGTNLALAGGDDTADITVAGPGGSFTKGLNFDGTSDWILHSARLTGVSPTAMSGCCWMKKTDDTSFGAVFAEWDSGAGATQSLRFLPSNVGKLRIDIGNSGGTSVNASTDDSYSTGVWQHIAFTYDTTGPALKFYIDGVDSSYTGTIPSTTNSSTGAHFSIGVAKTAAQPFLGALADVVLWDDVVLTEAQMQEVMAEGEDASGGLRNSLGGPFRGPVR